MPLLQHAQAPPVQRTSNVSTAVKAAIVSLITLNLLQLNLQSWVGRSSSTCRAQQPDSSSMSNSLRSWHRFGVAPMQQPRVLDASLPFPEQHFALFVIYAWNREVLLSSLHSYAAAGFGRRIVVIDNSPSRELSADETVRSLVGEVIPVRTRLSFSQAQNLLADIAIEREYEYYFWGHSDVALLAKDANSSFGADAVACMAAAMTKTPDWGIMYFAYDWFSAIRTDLVRKVQYDTFITVYKSDCDFYPRVRAAGYKTLNYQEVCGGESLGKVYDLNNAVDVPWDNYDAAKAVLDADEAARTGRFDWKLNAWGLDEHVGWAMWERSSHYYFRAKWGPMVDPAEICRIEVKSAATGEESLPQQPFGNLDSLQRRNWIEEDRVIPGLAALKGMRDYLNSSKAYVAFRERSKTGGDVTVALSPAEVTHARNDSAADAQNQAS